MSEGKINELMDILFEWTRSLNAEDAEDTDGDPPFDPPFADAKDLYSKIDACRLGHVTWQSFKVSYDGIIKEDDAPWKSRTYNIWF